MAHRGSPTASRVSITLARRSAAHGSDAVRDEALGEDRLDALPRIQTGHRILKDHLHPAATAPQFLAPQRRHVHAVEDDLTLGHRSQPQQGPAEGGLAAARLADQAVRAAALHCRSTPSTAYTCPTVRSKKIPRRMGK